MKIEGIRVIANRNNYVFFYVGDDVTQPAMLAKSIRLADESAHIIHCGDRHTPPISDVSMRVDFEGERRRIMSFRLKAFADLGLVEPAIYIDTDMLCVNPINSAELTKDNPTRFCTRKFNLDWSFNGNFGGLDFREYDKKPIGDVYPYVACATATVNADVWQQLYDILETLHPKFKLWYGDQEAMKQYCIGARLCPDAGLPETIYGCLPEQTAYVPHASLIHFKGASRKEEMNHAFARLTG